MAADDVESQDGLSSGEKKDADGGRVTLHEL